MSSYGTEAGYCRGYDDAASETAERYAGLVSAAQTLLENWQKNLTNPAQALQAELVKLGQWPRPAKAKLSRPVLDSTTYPADYDPDPEFYSEDKEQAQEAGYGVKPSYDDGFYFVRPDGTDSDELHAELADAWTAAVEDLEQSEKESA